MAANYEKFRDEVRSIIECVICTEILKDHRTLPCNHSFCLTCLNRCKSEGFKNNYNFLSFGSEERESTIFKCPLCRQIFTIPSGGFSALPVNFIINKLIDANQALQDEGLEDLNLSENLQETVDQRRSTIYENLGSLLDSLTYVSSLRSATSESTSTDSEATAHPSTSTPSNIVSQAAALSSANAASRDNATPLLSFSNAGAVDIVSQASLNSNASNTTNIGTQAATALTSTNVASLATAIPLRSSTSLGSQPPAISISNSINVVLQGTFNPQQSSTTEGSQEINISISSSANLDSQVTESSVSSPRYAVSPRIANNSGPGISGDVMAELTLRLQRARPAKPPVPSKNRRPDNSSADTSIEPSAGNTEPASLDGDGLVNLSIAERKRRLTQASQSFASRQADNINSPRRASSSGLSSSSMGSRPIGRLDRNILPLAQESTVQRFGIQESGVQQSRSRDQEDNSVNHINADPQSNEIENMHSTLAPAESHATPRQVESSQNSSQRQTGSDSTAVSSLTATRSRVRGLLDRHIQSRALQSSFYARDGSEGTSSSNTAEDSVSLTGDNLRISSTPIRRLDQSLAQASPDSQTSSHSQTDRSSSSNSRNSAETLSEWINRLPEQTQTLLSRCQRIPANSSESSDSSDTITQAVENLHLPCIDITPEMGLIHDSDQNELMGAQAGVAEGDLNSDQRNRYPSTSPYLNYNFGGVDVDELDLLFGDLDEEVLADIFRIISEQACLANFDA